MKVSHEKWKSATDNLNKRRKYTGSTDDNIFCDESIRDYGFHLRKCGFGQSILDVGCGAQTLKRHLPDGIEYIGVDAFPLPGIECIHSAIEDLEGIEVDTVCAFAVLDNCRDFFKACENMKKIARKNVIILTGINIEPDEYHTFKLQLSDFKKAFKDWDQTHYEQIQPKVWLLCYQRSV